MLRGLVVSGPGGLDTCFCGVRVIFSPLGSSIHCQGRLDILRDGTPVVTDINGRRRYASEIGAVTPDNDEQGKVLRSAGFTVKRVFPAGVREGIG